MIHPVLGRAPDPGAPAGRGLHHLLRHTQQTWFDHWWGDSDVATVCCRSERTTQQRKLREYKWARCCNVGVSRMRAWLNCWRVESCIAWTENRGGCTTLCGAQGIVRLRGATGVTFRRGVTNVTFRGSGTRATFRREVLYKCVHLCSGNTRAETAGEVS